MFDILQYDFVQNAFLAGSLVAIMAAVIGYFVVLRAQSFAGEALADIGFAGATGAAILGISSLLGMLGLVLLAVPAVANSLLASLERDLPLTAPADQPPQAIVVLGGDSQPGDEQGQAAQPGPLSLERERAAAVLHEIAQHQHLVAMRFERLHRRKHLVARARLGGKPALGDDAVRHVQKAQPDRRFHRSRSARKGRDHGIQKR